MSKICKHSVYTLSRVSHIDTLPKLRKDGFTKPSRATSASESPTIMSVMDIPTNWRRWRLLRGAVKQKSAFTLAEVLITLGIIGIVSALTLPVLMQNINGHKYRNQFKKSFSTLSQAVRMAQEQYELTFAMLDQTCDDTGTDANFRSNRSMCALLNGTLKGASYVGQASEIYGNKDIKIGDYPISDYLVYRLSDGSLVGFYKDLKTCTVPTGTQLTESVLTGTGALKNCLGFIDVNGDKNPNDLVQGTSADSVSWLFGMPTAFGYDDYGYGYEENEPEPSTSEARTWGYTGCTQHDDYYYCYNYVTHSYESIPAYVYNHHLNEGTIYNDDDNHNSNKDTEYMYASDGSYCDRINFYCYDAEGNKYSCGTSLEENFKYNEIQCKVHFTDSSCARAKKWCETLKKPNCNQYTNENYYSPCPTDYCAPNSNSQNNDAENNSSNYGHSYGSGYDGYDYGYNSGGSCSASTFDPSARCTVPNRRGFISDIFPIVFHDGVVEPASGPARAVLHQTK